MWTFRGPLQIVIIIYTVRESVLILGGDIALLSAALYSMVGRAWTKVEKKEEEEKKA